MSRARITPLEGQRLEALLDFVGRSCANAHKGVVVYPGGLQWWLRRIGKPGFDIAVLIDDDDVVGLALRDGSDVIVQTDVRHTDHLGDLLGYAETGVRAADNPEMFVSVAEDDDALRTTVLSRGYEPTERYGYELVFDLAGEPERPDVPPGFEIISLAAELTDAYIAMHRAAWSRPNAPSSYDRGLHDAVTAMPDFRYDMVPIVRAPDGALAAYCISWWDPRSATVEIEPLGTHPDHRRLGLARAIVREVTRRAWKLGAKYVIVWGIASNPEAKALYLSAGMHVRRVLREYRFDPSPDT